MSVQVIDNFSYKGKKGNFERDNFDTLQAMRSYPEDGIDDGHVCFCNEDGNHYKFNHLNSVDGATGRWRLHNKSVNTLTETGEGKVLDARQGKILKDLIDAKVIEAGGVSFDTVPTKGSTNPVTSNGIKEAMDEQAESINANTGVDDYPVFSESEAYSAGDVVNYNGKLYKFTADHAAGAWVGTDAESVNVKDLYDAKIESLSTNVNVFNGEIEFSVTEEHPFGAFYIRNGNLYNKGNNIKSVTDEVIVENTENTAIIVLCYDSVTDKFIVKRNYQPGTFVMMTVVKNGGIRQSIASINKYNGENVACFFNVLNFVTPEIARDIVGNGFFSGTIEYSTEENSNGVFTISAGNLYINGALKKQWQSETVINVSFSANKLCLVYNKSTENFEVNRGVDNNFLVAEIFSKNEIRNSCAAINIVNGVMAKSVFNITTDVTNLGNKVEEYDEYFARQSKSIGQNVTAGTPSYLNFYNSGEFNIKEGDSVVVSITANNVIEYSIVGYDLENHSHNILTHCTPNQEYTIDVPFDLSFLRAVITESNVTANERITLNFLKKNTFEKIENDIIELNSRVTELENEDVVRTNKLLNRYKPLYPINEEAITERPQSKFTSFKSFSPKIDYRGQIVFEGFTDYTTFDTTKAIHFEEKFVFINKAGNYPYTGVSYISSDLKEWNKYNHLTNFNASVLGNTVNQSWGLASNEYGLLVFQTTYKDSAYQNVNCLFWSLDGGRTFEPAINNLRANVTINKSELTDGKIISIDSTQITVTKAVDIQSYLSDMSGDTSEALISLAKNYLSNKCILSDNGNDTLRSLAGLLIELGYKVMLSDEELTVYYKELGIAGNNQTFTVGDTVKTFTGGADYSVKDDILDACSIDYPITNIYYKGTEILINPADLVLDNSILYVNGKWHLFGHYYDGTRVSILDLIIDDITNLPSSSYQYREVLSQNNNACVEPIATFSSLNNKIIVSFRNQTFGQPYKFVYSNDYGENWSDLLEVENSPKVFQANNAIFLATNPKESRGTEVFYNRPSSDTSNIYVALMYDRRTNAIYAATADVEENLEDLQWSDWITLNRCDDNLNRLGFDDLGLYFSDYSGFSSIGDFCYAPAHRGIALLYTGMKIVGKTYTYTAYTTLETC